MHRVLVPDLALAINGSLDWYGRRVSFMLRGARSWWRLRLCRVSQREV